MPLLSIIVPVYNEANLIRKSLPPIFNLAIDKKVVIINDGSSDLTLNILKDLQKKYNFKLINLETNQGKGSAIRHGLNYINSDFFTICDADLEYDPQELIKLLYHAQTKNNNKLAVYGSRFLNIKPKNFHYIVNAFLTKLTNFLFQTNLTDMETCFKLIPSSALKEIRLTAKRFEIEPQITAQLAKHGYQIEELPINYQRRRFNDGKKIKPKDGFLAIYMLLKEKLF
ncbi:MAG: glycosyltransferase family 2 protein [Patescibacteria group bacterium]